MKLVARTLIAIALLAPFARSEVDNPLGFQGPSTSDLALSMDEAEAVARFEWRFDLASPSRFYAKLLATPSNPAILNGTVSPESASGWWVRFYLADAEGNALPSGSDLGDRVDDTPTPIRELPAGETFTLIALVHAPASALSESPEARCPTERPPSQGTLYCIDVALAVEGVEPTGDGSGGRFDPSIRARARLTLVVPESDWSESPAVRAGVAVVAAGAIGLAAYAAFGGVGPALGLLTRRKPGPAARRKVARPASPAHAKAPVPLLLVKQTPSPAQARPPSRVPVPTVSPATWASSLPSLAGPKLALACAGFALKFDVPEEGLRIAIFAERPRGFGAPDAAPSRILVFEAPLVEADLVRRVAFLTRKHGATKSVIVAESFSASAHAEALTEPVALVLRADAEGALAQRL